MVGVIRNKTIPKHIMTDAKTIVNATIKKRPKSKKSISKSKSKKNQSLLLDDQIDIIKYNPFSIVKEKIIITSIKSSIYTISTSVL